MKIFLVVITFAVLLLFLGAGSVSAQGNTHTSCRDLGLYVSETSGYPGSPDWALNFTANNPGAVAGVNEQAQLSYCVSK